MKIRQQDNIVLSNSNAGEHSFGFKASAKAFQILSSSIYSRKIEAIVRELSCNAYDSHVQAGWPDRPFEVALPSEWESEFSVEDFGIGLSHDDVMHVYTTYFESTKTESNDVIGGLGLGSKTPFAYTDSFNVRARKDGVENTYNAYINADGMPAISLLTSHETEEPNGVKVTVPVRSADRHNFYNDCQIVHRWFEVKPVYKGVSYSPDVENGTLEALKETGYLTINPHNTYELTKSWTCSNYVRVLMGNVSYVVSDIRSQFADTLTPAENQFFTGNAVIVKFDIGDLDVAASRETISFDDVTKKVFFDKIRKCISDGIDEIAASTESMTYIEAINTVEHNLGAWATHWIDYKGVLLSDYVGKRVVDVIESLLPDEALNDIYYNRMGGKQSTRYAASTIGDMARQDSRIIAVVVGTPRGHQKIMRNVSLKPDVYWAVSVDELDEADRNALEVEFGGNIDFYDALEIVEEKKAESRRLAALRRADKAKTAGPTVKMGAEDARVVAIHHLEGFDLKSRHDADGILIKADELGERFAVVVSNRGVVHETSKFTEFGVTDKSAIKMLMTLYRLDTLVVVKNAQSKKFDRITEGLVAVDLTKEVFDTDLAFKTFMRKAYRGSRMLDCHVSDWRYDWVREIDPDWYKAPALDFVRIFEKELEREDVKFCADLHVSKFASYEFTEKCKMFSSKIETLIEDTVAGVVNRYASKYPLLASCESNTSRSDAAIYMKAMDRLRELEERLGQH